MKLKLILLVALYVAAQPVVFSDIIEKSTFAIALKTPGNDSKTYNLEKQNQENGVGYKLVSNDKAIPATISQKIIVNGFVKQISTTIVANEDIYFNFSQKIESDFNHNDCQFYMPGFWYRRNLRSPKEAPSFHTADSWIVREDRLSTPLTAIFNEKNGQYISVARIDEFKHDALTTHKEGEVILSGQTSIGYTGFENLNGKSALSFGFPYQEAPRTYIRKLTLAPKVCAFQYLAKGDSIVVVWEVNESKAVDFSDVVKQIWEYSYELYKPLYVNNSFTTDKMKSVISNYFTESYVANQALQYTSGVHLRVDNCKTTGIAEVGFVGRVLLNAFNALEYGEQQGRDDLVRNSRSVFESYLRNGFTQNGFFREVVDFGRNSEERNLSIRRQSEGLYAMLYYLQYERKMGRKHPEWEKKLETLLSQILKLQKEDGSFPRKFKDDLSVVDGSGGSTPSATPALVLASVYFKNKKFMEAAQKTAQYLDKEIISKSDYFSSTLDANCEDKEASFYATTALYHLALFTKGKQSEFYSNLARKSAYFCLSWYYTWDVPFAKGQMLGDIGLKTRGWGNVSVENNHIDVFIFDFATILKWLAVKYKEPQLDAFSTVINTSMRQLLPFEGHMCGVAKEGFYPEVVQHANWDYGRNGKGYYNDIFAPGWVVASLWEMLSPDRIQLFIK